MLQRWIDRLAKYLNSSDFRNGFSALCGQLVNSSIRTLAAVKPLVITVAQAAWLALVTLDVLPLLIPPAAIFLTGLYITRDARYAVGFVLACYIVPPVFLSPAY
jgi:hypothetical protein